MEFDFNLEEDKNRELIVYLWNLQYVSIISHCFFMLWSFQAREMMNASEIFSFSRTVKNGIKNDKNQFEMS